MAYSKEFIKNFSTENLRRTSEKETDIDIKLWENK
jgi:hypothetical protein